MENKKGDIYLNKFAGNIDCKYGVYLGKKDKRFSKLLTYIKGYGWKISFHDLKNKFHDGTCAYIKVGHTDFLNIAKQDLKQFKDKEVN